jgi:hypothetical protein
MGEWNDFGLPLCSRTSSVPGPGGGTTKPFRDGAENWESHEAGVQIRSHHDPDGMPQAQPASAPNQRLTVFQELRSFSTGSSRPKDSSINLAHRLQRERLYVATTRSPWKAVPESGVPRGVADPQQAILTG